MCIRDRKEQCNLSDYSKLLILVNKFILELKGARDNYMKKSHAKKLGIKMCK